MIGYLVAVVVLWICFNCWIEYLGGPGEDQ